MYKPTSKGYRKIAVFMAANLPDSYLPDMSMESFLDDQDIDRELPNWEIIIKAEHIAGKFAILNLSYSSGDLK